MPRLKGSLLQVAIALTAAILLSAGANAEPPPHAGGPNKDKGNAAKVKQGGEKGGGDYGKAEDASINVFFDSHHRDIIRDYYSNEITRQGCPPGLAKKNNGCMPPGQARKWRMGQQLPDDVIYYPLPRDLQSRLGYDNPAYELIRVGADILRIGVGTGTVVEALENLGGVQ